MFSTVGLKNHCPAPGTPVEAVWGGLPGGNALHAGASGGVPGLEIQGEDLIYRTGWRGFPGLLKAAWEDPGRGLEPGEDSSVHPRRENR